MTLFALVRSLKRQRAGQAAGFAAVTIAAAAFIGWWVSLPLLSSWGSGFATVKPMGALCLMALGLALMHPARTRVWHSRLVWRVVPPLPPVFSRALASLPAATPCTACWLR